MLSGPRWEIRVLRPDSVLNLGQRRKSKNGGMIETAV
jgi:hypothetical protein